MKEEQDFEINDEPFTITLTDRGWVYEHLDRRNHSAAIASQGFFATHTEALQAAMEYVSKFWKGYEEWHAEFHGQYEPTEDEERYGTYEQQVRQTYYANCL